MSKLIKIFDGILLKSGGNVKGYCFCVSIDLLEKDINDSIAEYLGNKVIYLNLLPKETVIYSKYTDFFD